MKKGTYGTFTTGTPQRKVPAVVIGDPEGEKVKFLVMDDASHGGVYVASAPLKLAGGDPGEYGDTFTPDA